MNQQPRQQPDPAADRIHPFEQGVMNRVWRNRQQRVENTVADLTLILFIRAQVPRRPPRLLADMRSALYSWPPYSLGMIEPTGPEPYD